MADEEQCQVQIKTPGGKWHFLTPDGGISRLWMHGVVMSRSRAETYAAELAASNPAASLRVVPAFHKWLDVAGRRTLR